MSKLIVFINSVPLIVWTGIGGTITGSLLTIVGVCLTNSSNNKRLRIQLQHEKDKRRDEIKRERAEELYVESKKYFANLGCYYLLYKRVMKGDLTLNEATELTIKNFSETKGEHHRVGMIVNMYFPELKNSFEEILNVRNDLSTIISSYQKQYETGNIDEEEWLTLFQDRLNKYMEKVKIFEKQIASMEVNL
jgi:hypothetical protein